MSRLLVRYMLDNVQTYTSIVDDNTFPEQRLPLIVPGSLIPLRNTSTLNSDDGLLCFFGDLDARTRRAVIWNPVGRSVGIDINSYWRTVVGFGVCHGDPKLVKISVKQRSYEEPTMWDVDVFSLDTREWINVHRDMQPFREGTLESAKVCLNGVIYFRDYGNIYAALGVRFNCFVSFNLESGEFGVVPFPVNLVHTRNYMQAAKVNESLGILNYHGGVCDVWTKEEGANEAFNMRYTVVVEGHWLYGDVLGFRNNGEVVVELEDDNNNEESRIVAYVPLGPLAGHITGVGINGGRRTFSARSYMETALLFDQPERDIIYPANPNHLLVRYMLDNVQTYTSIIDDDNFPEQRLPLIAPESLALLTNTLTLNSDDGWLCFFGDDLDGVTRRAVIWNPTVGRSVGIDINPYWRYEHTIVGFGVCDFDPKFVKISFTQSLDGRPMWDVEVFSLSTLVWSIVQWNMQPFRECALECAKVCLNGVIYFRAYDLLQNRSNFFISFNLESEEFGEVPFPENLVHTLNYIQAAKVNESLGILEYHLNDGGGMHVCTVWTRGHEMFNIIYTVVVEGHSLYGDVLGFRNNGEVVVELEDDNNNEESRIVAYVPLGPLAGHITGVGINGRRRTFSVRSYMETAHLPDQPEQHIIIH